MSEKVLIGEIDGTEMKLNHTEPVSKNLEIELPLTADKMKEPQESDTHIKHLLKQWKKGDLDKKVNTCGQLFA